MPAKSSTDINRILYSDDCLNVLNDELALPAGSVDLIYLDPPFNSKSIYNLPFAGKDRDARPVEAFADTWAWGTKEDDLLRELAAGPQSRNLADIINLVQRLDVPRSGGFPPTCSTWRCACWLHGGYWPRRGRCTCTVMTRPAITSSW